MQHSIELERQQSQWRVNAFSILDLIECYPFNFLELIIVEAIQFNVPILESYISLHSNLQVKLTETSYFSLGLIWPLL